MCTHTLLLLLLVVVVVFINVYIHIVLNYALPEGRHRLEHTVRAISLRFVISDLV